MRKIFSPGKISSRIVRGVNVSVADGADECVGFEEYNGGLRRGVCLYKAKSKTGSFLNLPENIAAENLFVADTSAGERFFVFSSGKLYVTDGVAPEPEIDADGVTLSGVAAGGGLSNGRALDGGFSVGSSVGGSSGNGGSGVAELSGGLVGVGETGENADAGLFKLAEDVSLVGSVSFAEIVYEGKRCVYIADDNGRAYVYDGLVFVSKTIPTGVRSVVSFGGKIILVTEDKALVSAKEDGTDDTDGDTGLDFGSDGAAAYSFGAYSGVKKAVCAGGEVVFASPKGLFRLGSGVFDGEFFFKNIETGGMKIYPETLASKEGKAFVMSDGGLILYDGAGVSVKHPEICELIAEGVFGFSAKGGYFATVVSLFPYRKIFTVCFKDGGYYNTGLEIMTGANRADGSFAFVERKKRYICALEGTSRSKGEKAIYKTNPTDFGIDGRKTLAYLKLSVSKNVLLTVCADGVKSKYVLRSGNGYVRPYVSGKEFSFAVECDYDDVRIFSPRAEIEFV